MTEPTITVVTRTDSKGFDKCIAALKNLECENISEFYVICDGNQKSYEQISGKNVNVFYDAKPTSPTAMNKIIDKLGDSTKYLLIFSKEVEVIKKHVEAMLKELTKKSNVLVVGYRLRVKGRPKLDYELQRRYLDKNLIAFQVPWNTCAMWNYLLFKKYVKKFDEVTTKNLFPKLNVYIDGEVHTIPHQGMEDALAIAQAVSIDSELRYKLINNPKLNWVINDEQKFREKLERKDVVLGDYMALRGYSAEDLSAAKL